MDKPKTISGPYQTYQIRVSVSTLAEIQSMQPPGVNGAPTFFRDQRLPWHWFEQLPAGITSSPDATTGATTGKSGFWVSLAALLTAVSLGSFLTVARASASRMLDLPLATLYTVRDGARTYVRSVLSGWHWEANFPAATPTDNITTCRPTAWIATALDGAFVRDTEGSQTAWRQGAWFIDSTAPDNEGAGTALDPLQTDVELGRRWGPEPLIPQPTTVRWAQPPAGLTNLRARAQVGAGIIFQGTPTVKRPAVTLTNVIAQNRAVPTAWAIDGAAFDATDVGQIVVIDQSANPANIGTYAYVVERAGTVLTVSPFGKPAANISAFPPFVQVTPLVGDVVRVITPMLWKPGLIKLEGDFDQFQDETGAVNCFFFEDLDIGSQVTFTGGMIEVTNANAFYTRCVMNYPEFAGFNGGFGTRPAHHLLGGGCFGGFNQRGGCIVNMWKTGCREAFVIPGPGACLAMDSDTYFFNSVILQFSNTTIISRGAAWFNQTFPNSAVYVEIGSTWFQNGAIPDWGTGNAGHGVFIAASANYIYTTKPTVNAGLGAGREALIGGSDQLYAAVPFINPANNAGLILSA